MMYKTMREASILAAVRDRFRIVQGWRLAGTISARDVPSKAR